MHADEYRPLMRHSQWATERLLDAFEAVGPLPEKAIHLLDHMLGAQEYFRLKIAQERLPERWEPLADCASLRVAFAKSADAWLDLLETLADADLRRIITTSGNDSEARHASVRDGIQQVILHSQYHRGQLATLVRQHGGEPPLTDYIAWVWTQGEGQ